MKSLPIVVVLALGLLTLGVASGLAAQRVDLPDPDLTALEPSVAAQLEELRGLADTMIHNNLASTADKARAWGEMGKVFHAYQLLTAADTCYRQASALDDESADWPYYRGQVAMAAGDLEAAQAAFAIALQLRPEDPATLVYMADVEHALGDRAEARALLKRASELPSPEPVVWSRLGELALAEGRHARAVELLTAVLEAVPQATRLHHPLGLAYRGLGDMELARRHLALRGEIGLAPSDPRMDQLASLQVGERVHLLRGRSAHQAGGYAKAAEEFRLAVDAKPDSVRARVNLSASLAALGDAEGALRELQHAVALDPASPTARFNLATLLASAGEHELAVVHFAAATEAQAGDEQAWLGQAKSWIALGDFERATTVLRLANTTLPESGLVAFGLARLLAAAPDPAVRDGEKALDLATRIFAAQRTAEHAVLRSLALRELGRCDEVRQWLDELIAEAQSTGTEAEAERLGAERAALGEATPCRP